MTYNLLDHDGAALIFTRMIAPGSRSWLRAFRAVSSQDRIYFDDVRIHSPWTDPKDTASHVTEHLSMLGDEWFDDASFSEPDRLPQFSIARQELEHWLFRELTVMIPAGYRSPYTLYPGPPRTRQS